MGIRRLLSAIAAITILTTPAHAQRYEQVQTLYDEIAEPEIIRISQDGENLYLRSSGSFNVYQTDPESGNPILIQTILFGDRTSNPLGTVSDFVVSSNDRFVYLVDGFGGAIRVYERSSIDGSLTEIQSTAKTLPDLSANSNRLAISLDNATLVRCGTRFEFVAGEATTIRGHLTTYSIDPSTGQISQAMYEESGGAIIPEGVAFEIPLLSRDGNFLYVTDRLSNKMHILAHNPSDHTFSYGSAFEVPPNTTGFPNRLAGLLFSPDEKFLYGARYHGENPFVFARNNSTGDLTMIQNNVPATMTEPYIGGPLGISIDGLHVYASLNKRRIAIYSRDIISGLLTFQEIIKLGLDDTTHHNGISVFAVDTRHFYFIDPIDDAIQTFDRSASTGSITLQDTYLGIDGASSIYQFLAPPNDEIMYGLSGLDDALTTFERNPADGSLAIQHVEREDFETVAGVEMTTTVDGKFGYGPSAQITSFDTETGLPTVEQSALLGKGSHVIVGEILYGPSKFSQSLRDYSIALPSDVTDLASSTIRSSVTASALLGTKDNRNLYVWDEALQLIHVLYTSFLENPLFTLASPTSLPRSETDEIFGPIALKISEDEKQLYVADPNNHAVYVFTRESTPPTIYSTAKRLVDTRNTQTS